MIFVLLYNFSYLKLTNTKANNGNGPTVPPTTVVTVPNDAVIKNANANAATGELITAGNCNAINTAHITTIA